MVKSFGKANIKVSYELINIIYRNMCKTFTMGVQLSYQIISLTIVSQSRISIHLGRSFFRSLTKIRKYRRELIREIREGHLYRGRGRLSIRIENR